MIIYVFLHDRLYLLHDRLYLLHDRLYLLHDRLCVICISLKKKTFNFKIILRIPTCLRKMPTNDGNDGEEGGDEDGDTPGYKSMDPMFVATLLEVEVLTIRELEH